MAKLLKCEFNRVNGDKTGAFCRTGKGVSYPSNGILFMTKCPDGKTFLVDPADSAGFFFKLVDPAKYGLPATYAYVNLNDKSKYLKSIKEIETNEPKPPPKEITSTPEPPPKPVIPPAKPPITNLTNLGTSFDNSAGNVKTATIWHNSSAEYTSDTVTVARSINVVKGFADYEYMKAALKTAEKNLNINVGASNLVDLRSNMMTKFNRFKIPYPDLQLTKSFAHVFFTRPDLNLYNSIGSGNYQLIDKVKSDSLYRYMHNNDPNILLSLTKYLSGSHDFNPFLSNMAQSFEISDEFIKSAEHGETYTGFKIKYGRHNIESLTAGNFSVSYIDDDDLRVYKIHKAWIDYISKIYRGEFSPKRSSIINRELDYAVSVYYILCGADDETIIFWSKYTGVFPTNTPAAVTSWSKGNMLKMPEFSIQYDYAWKEDFNPDILAEFNLNSESETRYEYISTYEPDLVSTGKTFTGAPYIEAINNGVGKYIYKLRHRVK